MNSFKLLNINLFILKAKLNMEQIWPAVEQLKCMRCMKQTEFTDT